MENKSHALIAGVFMIALSVVLGLAVLWFDRDTLERQPYVLTTRASVSGLTEESAVRYRGLNVGKVERIRFDPEVPGQILVRILVEKGTPITRSTFATLGYQGVTGLAYVQFDDDGKSATLLETSKAHPARIEIRPGLFDKLAGSSEGLMLQLDEIARKVNLLLGPENQQLFRATLTHLDATATAFGRLGPRLEPSLEALPQAIAQGRRTLAAFDGVAGDVSRLAENYNALAVRVQERGGVLDRMGGSLQRFDRASEGLQGMTDYLADESLPRIDRFVDESSRSVRAVGRVADHLSDQPQSLLIGDAVIPPGPGEAGFTANP